MVHHEKPNTLIGLRKLIQAIDANIGNAKRTLPRNRAPDLLEKKSEHKSTLTSPINKSGKGSSNPKQKNHNSALPRARAQLPNRRSPTFPTFPRNSGKTKANTTGTSARLDNKLCLFCGTAGHIPRTVRNPARLPPKPKHPSLNRTNPRLPARIRKKTEQSSKLRTT